MRRRPKRTRWRAAIRLPPARSSDRDPRRRPSQNRRSRPPQPWAAHAQLQRPPSGTRRRNPRSPPSEIARQGMAAVRMGATSPPPIQWANIAVGMRSAPGPARRPFAEQAEYAHLHAAADAVLGAFADALRRAIGHLQDVGASSELRATLASGHGARALELFDLHRWERELEAALIPLYLEAATAAHQSSSARLGPEH